MSASVTSTKKRPSGKLGRSKSQPRSSFRRRLLEGANVFPGQGLPQEEHPVPPAGLLEEPELMKTKTFMLSCSIMMDRKVNAEDDDTGVTAKHWMEKQHTR